MNSEPEHHPRRFRTYIFNALMWLAVYVLSSGPVLGLAFWLRERTGLDQFYAIMWLYYPIVILRPHSDLLYRYIGWWVIDVFHTVGPG